MKTFLYVLVVMSFLSWTARWNATANELTNPGFEGVDDAHAKGWTPWSWAPEKNSPDAECSIVDNEGRNASRAAKITVKKKGHVGVWCNTPALADAKPGEKYLLSVWVRSLASDIVKCQLSVGFTDEKFTKNEKGVRQTFDLFPNNVWHRLTMPVSIPEAFPRVRIDVSLRSPGTVFIDDVEFIPEKQSLQAPGAPFVLLGTAPSPPEIDGKLDDACWSQCVECSNFLLTGGKGIPKARTSARVCRDSNNIYFAFVCEEEFLNPALNQIHRFRGECERQDGPVWEDDSVEIFIKSLNDDKFQLIVNSLGTVFDMKLTEAKDPGAWTSGLRAASTISDHSWTLEAALPLVSLGIDEASSKTISRLNLCRTRQPVREFSSWSPVPKGFADDAHWGFVAFTDQTPGVTCEPLKLKRDGAFELKTQFDNPSDASLKANASVNLGVDGKYHWTFAEDATVKENSSDSLNVNVKTPSTLAKVECRFADLDYAFTANGRLLYQSPSFHSKIGDASHLVHSRLGKAIPHSNEFKELNDIAIPIGQTERLDLMLTSAKHDQLPDTVDVILETPFHCSLTPPSPTRDAATPSIIKETLFQRQGTLRRRYHMTISKRLITESDAPEWELIPIPLFFSVTGTSAEPEDAIIYQASIPVLKHTEKERRLSIRVLPPLPLKKTSKRLRFMIWPWWPFHSITQFGSNERRRILSQWRDTGFNTVATELQLNDGTWLRSLKENDGFDAMKMAPILTAGVFPGAARYLKAHPEERAVSFSDKPIDSIKIPLLLDENTGFLKTVEKVIADMARKYDIIHVDYEFGIFKNNSPGYSKENIERFRQEYGIGEEQKLDVSTLAKDYREQWTEFRCRQNGDVLQRYRDVLDDIDANCLFGAYSAYQAKKLKRGHYGVDWNAFAKPLDLVMCGYGRGDYKATRKAIGPDKSFAGGEGVWGKDYDTSDAEIRLFQRMIDCGSGFMVFYDGVIDGRFYSAAARVIATAADFESFFLSPNRVDETIEIQNPDDVDQDAVAALQNENGERLVFLFNGTDKPKHFVIRNLNLPKTLRGFDYLDKSTIKNPEEFSCDVPPKKVKVIYLHHHSETVPVPPFPRLPNPECPAKSNSPIFTWKDNGRTNVYQIECRQQETPTPLWDKTDITGNVARAPHALPPGPYEWRVKADDAASGESSEWSAWTAFTVPAVLNAKASPEMVSPNETVTLSGDVPNGGAWKLSILDDDNREVKRFRSEGLLAKVEWNHSKPGRYQAIFSSQGVPSPSIEFQIDEKRAKRNPSIERLGVWTPMLWGGYDLTKDVDHLCEDYDVTRSGTYSLKIVKPKNAFPFWSTHYRGYPDGSAPIRVKSGEKWRFSVWIKNSNEKVKSDISIFCVDENNVCVARKKASRTGTTDWTKTTVELDVPPTGIRLRFSLGSSGVEGVSWFDCFELKQMGENEGVPNP